MNTILLDVYNEKVEEISVEDNLEEIYGLLDCCCVDIVERKIGGKWFDVMCDDNGLFHDPQKISAIDDMGVPRLVGNLMFFHNDGEGNLVGLSEDDKKHLRKYIKKMSSWDFPHGYPILCQCEYR